MFKTIAKIWCDWMDYTGCDGFRIDTFKHVPLWVSQDMVTRFRDHAKKPDNKRDFFVLCEVGGGDIEEARYLQYVPSACLLELGERRVALRDLARGIASRASEVLMPPTMIYDRNKAIVVPVVEDKEWLFPVERLVMTIDDHDGLSLDPLARIAHHGTETVLPAVAFLFFGPSIPCLYYGTEQALHGPDEAGEQFLLNFGLYNHSQGGDRYLREAMFGPEHPRQVGTGGRPDLPRKPGRAGQPVGCVFDENLLDEDSSAFVSANSLLDKDLPGFGPGGSVGHHVFDWPGLEKDHEGSPWFLGTAALADMRNHYSVLSTGTIALLPRGRVNGGRFGRDMASTTVAWLRYDANEWAIIVVDLADRVANVPPREIDIELPDSFSNCPDLIWNVQLLRDAVPIKPGTRQALDLWVPTGMHYLPLGPMAAGEIRVYVSGERLPEDAADKRAAEKLTAAEKRAAG